MTAFHSMQSPLPHAKPDTSGQWKEYGDEGILFSMSCCLPSQTYHDYCGRNPCSSHQEHGICIKLRPKALPTRVLLHLRDLYSKKSKTKTKTKKKYSDQSHYHCLLNLIQSLELFMKVSSLLRHWCESVNIAGWGEILWVGQHSFKKHSCLHQYIYQSPYFHSPHFNSSKKNDTTTLLFVPTHHQYQF